ncbi:MAG: GDSL-type esterase/lipase family protein [Planctomycetota bacterium]
MTRSTRRLRAIAIGFGFALVAFELAMQGLAYLTWRKHGGFSVRTVASEHAVLCVGDSFTFGLGASGGNDYPRQAETLLRESIADAVVVNGGKAGQDSADVLRRLAAQFAAVEPRLVYVLVGHNDRFRHPEPITIEPSATDEQDTGFPLRVRTLALFGRIAHSLFGDDPVTSRDVSPLLGTWHSGEFEIEFGLDGDLRVGDRHSRWSSTGTGIALALQPDEPIEAEWSVVVDRLRLRSESLGSEPLEFERGPRRVDPYAAIVAALAKSDVEVAQASLSALRAAGDDSPTLHALRARCLFVGGQATTANEMLGELEARILRAGDRVVVADVEPLVAAHFAMGNSAKAVALAGSALAAAPGESELWWMLVRHSATDPRDDERILEIAESALSTASSSEPWRAALHRLRAGILDRRADREIDALASTVQAALIDGNEAHVVQRLTDRPPTRAAFESAVASLGLDRGQREQAEQWWREATAAKLQPAAVLSIHLMRMAEFCRSRGAQLVVLNYPEPLGELGDSIAETARRGGLPLIDVEADFRIALRSTQRDQLFVADGHCNDAGYARIARLVAEDAKVRLRR